VPAEVLDEVPAEDPDEVPAEEPVVVPVEVLVVVPVEELVVVPVEVLAVECRLWARLSDKGQVKWRSAEVLWGWALGSAQRQGGKYSRVRLRCCGLGFGLGE
jgi:hypothetical protein